MICENILDHIGHTPMIRLNRMVGPDSAEVLVKFEGLNVGGSIKTRTAYNMIRQAEREGIHKRRIQSARGSCRSGKTGKAARTQALYRRGRKSCSGSRKEQQG